MKNVRINFLTILLLGLIAGSCDMLDKLDDQKDPAIDKTATYPMNGEWWVTYRIDDGTGNLADAGIVWGIGEIGHLKVLTYNTAENVSNKLWVSDVTDLSYDASGNFWSYRVISDLNLGSKSFSVDTATNAAYDSHGNPYEIQVSIKSGKVLLGQGRSRTGVVTDSIYYEIEFSDDPGTIYYVAGHRRTGFYEDEY